MQSQLRNPETRAAHRGAQWTFNIPAEKGAIFPKSLESFAAFWNPAVDKTTRVKTARTNQYLHEISHTYSSQHHRKYTSDATSAFRRRGDIGKARQLNSNRRQQWLTKHPGRAPRCGRDQTPDFLRGNDNARATTAVRKRVNKNGDKTFSHQFLNTGFNISIF